MPSGHSGSSHSGGGSFHGGGSSRSFSSHSSGSSFRSSPSSHSSSSRSSFGGSSSFRSSPSSSFRSSPSSHSSSSRSSFGSTSYSSPSTSYRPSAGRSSFATAQPVVRRTRVNQPRVRSGISPLRTIYCLTHDYTYYPSSWTADDGTTYKAGYYDENGQYYENVKVENATEDLPAILTCEYCGTETKYKWTEGTIPNCPNCGAPLTIKEAQTDTAVSSDSGSTASYTSSQSSTGSSSGLGSTRSRKKGSLLMTIVLIVIGISIFNSCINNFSGSSYSGYSSSGSSYSGYSSSYDSSYSGTGSSSGGLTIYDSSEEYEQAQSSSFSAVTDEYLRLSSQGNGIYDYASSADDVDKELVWSSEDEAYYDEETGFWLWYNENAGTWQYWIEGVSSNYGNYGWMECEGSDWYVEASSNNWKQYTGDTSDFWHIKNSFD